MIKSVRCASCGNFVRQDDDGWLFPHLEPGGTGEVCMSRVPAPSRPDEYPVGYDSDPWVMRGGLPERDRRRF